MKKLRHFHGRLPSQEHILLPTNPMLLITMGEITQANAVNDKIKMIEICEQLLSTEEKFMLVFVWQGTTRTDVFEVLPDEYKELIALLS